MNTAAVSTSELILIPADLAQPVTREPMEVLINFDPLHRAIPEGYVEALQVRWHGAIHTMFVHADGQLLKLPVNARASAVYGNWRTRGPQTDKADHSYDDLDADPVPHLCLSSPEIVGDCFLFTGRVGK